MEQSPLRHTIRTLVHAMAAVCMPAQAKTVMAVKAPVSEVTYRLIDFFTLELILLGGLVLLAFVFIARRPGTH